jgi:tRNA(fMet)-specific endonuclease VapC
MYLLDTTHCIDLVNGREDAVKKFSEHRDVPVTTCAVVCGELFNGAYKSGNYVENENAIESFLSDIQIYPTDKETAKVYAKVKHKIIERFGPKKQRDSVKLEQLGFGENDLWIASIAIQHSLIVVSADNHFKRLQDMGIVSIETW